MNMNEQIELLNVPLPEDVLKHKWHGDFAAAQRIIERRLQTETADVMRRRLLLEQKILKRLPGNYPYDREKACELLAAAVQDFRSEELTEIMDSDYADWIYIDGEPHFRYNLVSNLLKTRPDYAARRICAPEEPDPEDEYLGEALETMRRDGGMERTIRLRARLWLEEEPMPGEEVRVYLPIPCVDGQVTDARILCAGADLPEARKALRSVTVAPEHAPQRTICWEAAWQPGLEFSVEYEYDIRAGYIDLWNGLGQEEDAQKRTGAYRIPAGYEEWKEKYGCFDQVTEDDLSEQQPHIVFSPMMRELTAQVVGEETRPLEKARLIYDYVTTQIHYSYMRSYVTLPCISEYVASGHKGDCGAQTILFITMCRLAGIPARWQSGLYANPARVGSHDWARFYIPEYGWLFADCSFGGGEHRAGKEDLRRFYFGNLEPYRMPSCRRFQTNFEPPMEKLRCDPYDAQCGEVERESEEAHDRYAFDSETVMVECRPLES